MIGERLAEIRKDYGETQADLAERLSVSLPTVRAWEQEKSSPSHESLVQICKIYQVSSDYLLGLSDIDPSYIRRYRHAKFSKEEIAQIRDYEDYVVWKRAKGREIGKEK